MAGRTIKHALGLLSIAATAAGTLAYVPPDINEPLHYRLASDLTLEGIGDEGSCMDYAVALSSKLSEPQAMFSLCIISRIEPNG